MHDEPNDHLPIRTLRADDVGPTAALLARTFLHNPAYVFMHPCAGSRAWDLERFFLRNLSWRLALGLSWVMHDRDGRVRATATLEPPGGVPHSTRALLRHWVLPTLREQGPRTVARIIRADASFARTYRALSAAPRYWHVHAVAVDERLRGRGLGSQLLRHLLTALDRHPERAAAPVLLSTQRERNLPLYRRAGFELLAQVRFDGYPSWFMRRQAQAARTSSPRAPR